MAGGPEPLTTRPKRSLDLTGIGCSSPTTCRAVSQVCGFRSCVLVTSAAGFIGSRLRSTLADGHTVVGLDNFNDMCDPALEANIGVAQQSADFELIRGDILDTSLLAAVFDQVRPNCIVTAAWAVRPSIERPALYQKVNIEGTQSLERCRHGGGHVRIRLIVLGCNNRDESISSRRRGPAVSPTPRPRRPADCSAPRIITSSTQRSLPAVLYGVARANGLRWPSTSSRASLQQTSRSPCSATGAARDYTYVTDIAAGVVASVARCEGYRIFNLGESKPSRSRT